MPHTSQKKVIHNLLVVALSITGVIVSLAVGTGMISGVLSVWYVPNSVTDIAGWVVVIFTLVSILIAILELFDRK